MSTEAADKAPADAAPARPTPECALCRWVEVKQANISFRYRTVTDSQDTRTMNQLQHRELADIAFKFDKEGRYTVNAHASSGYYFNWAYAGTYAGTTIADSLDRMADHNGIPRIYFKGTAPNAEGSNFWVRQLYFQAKPVDGVEFQYGSLPINKGVNTEVTSYDDDGYVAGARLSLKMPKRLFFDEISYTHAYLGDIVTPNFFRRYDRLTTSNYRQFLVAKNVGTRAQVSGDFTYHDSVKTLREAVKVNTKEAKVVDNVRFETYQRLNDFTYFNAAANANDGGGAGLGILGRGREGDPQARHARRRLQQD